MPSINRPPITTSSTGNQINILSVKWQMQYSLKEQEHEKKSSDSGMSKQQKITSNILLIFNYAMLLEDIIIHQTYDGSNIMRKWWTFST